MAVVFESSVGLSRDTVRPYPLAREGPSLLHCGARYALACWKVGARIHCCCGVFLVLAMWGSGLPLLVL